MSRKVYKTRIANTKIDFLDDNPIINRATEPSDIIWENYSITKGQILRNKILAYIFLAIFNFLLFGCFILLKRTKPSMSFYFPKKIECHQILGKYMTNS